MLPPNDFDSQDDTLISEARISNLKTRAADLADPCVRVWFRMVSQTLLGSALFALTTSAIYAFVGYRLTRRELPKGGRLAAAGFVAFWYGLAISSLLGGNGIQALLGAFESLTLGMVLVLTQVSLLAICVALWGLLYYLVYLYTGWHRAWVPIAVFYVVFYGFLQYFIWDAGPTGLRAERWGIMVEYEKDIENASISDPYILALVIGLLVPQMLAALAYLTLVFGVKNPTQRYRILLVSLSILVWFGSPFLALGAGVSESDDYQLASRLIGLGAAIVIFCAYHPPGFIRRRYGVASLSDESKPKPILEESVPPRTGFEQLVTSL